MSIGSMAGQETGEFILWPLTVLEIWSSGKFRCLRFPRKLPKNCPLLEIFWNVHFFKRILLFFLSQSWWKDIKNVPLCTQYRTFFRFQILPETSIFMLLTSMLYHVQIFHSSSSSCLLYWHKLFRAIHFHCHFLWCPFPLLTPYSFSIVKHEFFHTNPL